MSRPKRPPPIHANEPTREVRFEAKNYDRFKVHTDDVLYPKYVSKDRARKHVRRLTGFDAIAALY